MCVFRKICTRNVILENYPQESMNEAKPTLCMPLKITSSFPVTFEHYKNNVLLAGSLSSDEMLTCLAGPSFSPSLQYCSGCYKEITLHSQNLL